MTENIYIKHRKGLSRLEKFAVWITERIGTMGFFSLVLFWTAIWLTWNTMGPIEHRFDPFPAFVLWLFISNMIQLFLLPLIMISQNLQEKHAELRAENDYEVNIKAEKEIQEVKNEIKKYREMISELLEKSR